MEIPKLEVEGIHVYALTLGQDALLLGTMLVLTLIASAITYRLVEMPANRWFRNLASKRSVSPAQAIQSAA